MGAAMAGCLSLALIAAGLLWDGERRLSLEVPWMPLGAVLAAIFAVGVAGAPAWPELRS